MFDPVLPGSGSGLVVSWEQETGILLASGDVRFIRVWDTQREMRMQVRDWTEMKSAIPIGALNGPRFLIAYR